MKKVRFSDKINIFSTYSSDEYSRIPIDHLLYRRAYNRVSDLEWNDVLVKLDLYKLYEMPVHPDSFLNNNYTLKSKK